MSGKETSAVTVIEGDSPLVLGQPHGGTGLPDAIARQLNPIGLALADTDWHIGQLYDGLIPGATIVRANFHRYIIDANRDPSGASLYPGQNTTDLCPTTDFDGRPIYRPGQEPDAAEIDRRRQDYHRPYHGALQTALARCKARHGIALLYDCHSIRSRIPHLFDGRLPDLNIGTYDRQSTVAGLENAVVAACQRAEAQGYQWVLNGRFKGGWTTRHYGAPAQNVHAVQMELSQCCYMQEQAPWRYEQAKAERLRPILHDVLVSLLAAAKSMRAE